MRKTATFNALDIVRVLGLALAALALMSCGDGWSSETETASTDPVSTIAFVQGSTGRSTASFGKAQTAGDLNVVIVGWGDDTTTISSITDTVGNSYAVAAPMKTGSGTLSPPLRQAIYYAKNIKGSSGTNTVTVTFSKTPSYPDLRILEYSGADRTAPLDVVASGSGTASGTSVSTATATTTAAAELIVGAGMTTYVYAGAGSSFTQRFISSDGNIAEDRVVSTTGAYRASALLTSVNQSWLMQMATFKAAGSSALALTSISPTSGTTAGGTSVTLNGSNFASGATVTFCGTAASSVTFVSASQLTAKTPAHAAGTCDVKVTNPNGQSATLTSAFTYASSSSTIAWVQTASGGHGSTSATFSAAQTAGDLNVVVVGWGDNTHTISGVTDTNGNSYAVAAPMLTGSGTVSPPLRQAIYYAKNIKGGANTVTVQFSGAPTYPDLRILEYSGLDATAPFDVAASGSGNASGGTVATASATTTSPYELIVGAGMTTASSYGGPGSSFVERVITADGNIAEDRIVNASSSYAASAVLESTTQSWLMQMVTFKAGSGGTCTAKTTCPAGDNCGTVSDGCGGTINCGTCTAPATCGGGGTPNVCGTSTTGTSYSTNFPLTENPISEGGKWIGGQAAGGNLWGNVQTKTGLAFGVSEPTTYGDPTAALTGTWGRDQTSSMVIKINVVPKSCCAEVELRFRTTISTNSITGYEVLCPVYPNAGYGIQVVRWNGPNGSFDYLGTTNNTSHCVNGDVLKASVTGTNPTTITVYKNGTLEYSAEDTGASGNGFGAYGPWTSGSPGIGFYNTAGSAWSDFGVSSFTTTTN